jgi:hypothetical protein
MLINELYHLLLKAISGENGITERVGANFSDLRLDIQNGLSRDQVVHA